MEAAQLRHWFFEIAGGGNGQRQRFAVEAQQTARGGFDKLRMTPGELRRGDRLGFADPLGGVAPPAACNPPTEDRVSWLWYRGRSAFVKRGYNGQRNDRQ